MSGQSTTHRSTSAFKVKNKPFKGQGMHRSKCKRSSCSMCCFVCVVLAIDLRFLLDGFSFFFFFS
jgi:hypothetical protein